MQFPGPGVEIVRYGYDAGGEVTSARGLNTVSKAHQPPLETVYLQHVGYDEDQHAIEDFSPERVLLAREQVAMVRTVLERLPERVRAAFVLHRFDELGYAEIAKRLGVSVSSIEKYISQAMKELTAARMRDEL